MSELERAFHNTLMAVTRECKRLGYNPTYALQMVAESGPVGACKRLLEKPDVSEGFTRLWELGRLDLTVEALVLRPEFAPLFTDEERSVARERLNQVGYVVPSEPR